jgi:hypothetical protein
MEKGVRGGEHGSAACSTGCTSAAEAASCRGRDERGTAQAEEAVEAAGGEESSLACTGSSMWNQKDDGGGGSRERWAEGRVR